MYIIKIRFNIVTKSVIVEGGISGHVNARQIIGSDGLHIGMACTYITCIQIDLISRKNLKNLNNFSALVYGPAKPSAVSKLN